MAGEVSDPARLIATQLVRRGLGVPARLLLDAHRPLAPLAADAGAALGPLLRMVGISPGSGLASLMGDERAMQRVIGELDAIEAGRAEPG